MEDNGDNSLSYSDNLYEQFIEDEKKRIEEDKKILESIKPIVSDKFFNDIKTTLENSDYSYNYRITDKPIGQIQEEEELEEVKHIYVEQDGGGITGDIFAGTISIQLVKDKYFTFDYSC